MRFQNSSVGGSWRTLRQRSMCFAACLTVFTLTAVMTAVSEEPRALVSGRPVGEQVPKFYVRAVTGPQMNKSICYVCRNGDRPGVIVFMRDIVPGTAELLKEIDRFVDQNRAVGLRSFGVLLSDNQISATSKLQTLSYDNQLSLPLTMAPPQVESSENQNLHPNAAVTVVLYDELKVTASYAFRENEMTKERISNVMVGIRELVAKTKSE
jgi:hypothetical protein